MATQDHMPEQSDSENTQGSPKRKVRYAVVGLGYIAQAAVLPAFAHAQDNSELVALVSGEDDKLKKLARKYKVKRTYTYEQYADCLSSGEIDAVYIALPNNMHASYAEGAAQAGIHVLCEKPMAVTQQECQAMIDAAERAKVKLMIAYRLHFEKGNLSAVETVKSGQIGEPRIFRSAFCQQVAAGNSRLQGDLGGGPLYDIGIYCINAARYLFGAEPQEVFAYAATGKDERFREVQEMSAAVMRFPDERLATFTCSFGAADRSTYEVIGTKGVLKKESGLRNGRRFEARDHHRRARAKGEVSETGPVRAGSGIFFNLHSGKPRARTRWPRRHGRRPHHQRATRIQEEKPTGQPFADRCGTTTQRRSRNT